KRFIPSRIHEPSGEPKMPIRTLAVIGAGTMGRGIIETAAVNRIKVLAAEPNEAQRLSAKSTIEKSIAKGIQRGKVALKSPDEALARITWQSDVTAIANDAGFIVEAASEDPAIKEEIFRQLDRAARPGVILASNTSSISITRLAAVTNRPDSVVGMHFF